MAGQGLLTEGFREGQVGSSVMPHKVNARNCERICGFHVILGGHVAMTAALSGDQWNEGDVSCSVVRRVALPDAFFAIDGLFETFLTVLEQMEVFPGRDRRGERAQPAVPRHDHDPDGGGQAGRRPRGGACGDQGARAGGGAGVAIGRHQRRDRSAGAPRRRQADRAREETAPGRFWRRATAMSARRRTRSTPSSAKPSRSPSG